MIIPDTFFKYQALFYCFDKRPKTCWVFAQQRTFFFFDFSTGSFFWGRKTSELCIEASHMNTEDDKIITLDNIFDFHDLICLATKTAPFMIFLFCWRSRITGEIILAVTEGGTQLSWRNIIFRCYEHVEWPFPCVNVKVSYLVDLVSLGILNGSMS